MSSLSLLVRSVPLWFAVFSVVQVTVCYISINSLLNEPCTVVSGSTISNVQLSVTTSPAMCHQQIQRQIVDAFKPFFKGRKYVAIAFAGDKPDPFILQGEISLLHQFGLELSYLCQVRECDFSSLKKYYHPFRRNSLVITKSEEWIILSHGNIAGVNVNELYSSLSSHGMDIVQSPLSEIPSQESLKRIAESKSKLIGLAVYGEGELPEVQDIHLFRVPSVIFMIPRLLPTSEPELNGLFVLKEKSRFTSDFEESVQNDIGVIYWDKLLEHADSEQMNVWGGYDPMVVVSRISSRFSRSKWIVTDFPQVLTMAFLLGKERAFLGTSVQVQGISSACLQNSRGHDISDVHSALKLVRNLTS
jgi:hypothetical protein